MMRPRPRPRGPDFPFPVGRPATLLDFARGVRSLVRTRESAIRDARVVLVDLPADPAAARRILPVGMRPADPPRARLFVASYGESVYSAPYREASLVLAVRTPLGTGGHIAWMVVDDDTALVYGRELLACPKKLAEIGYEERDGVVEAHVRRRGVDLISIRADADEPEPDPGSVLGERAFNVGGLGQLFAVSPIWMFKLVEMIHGSSRAMGTVTLGESAFDPIRRIVGPIANPVPARIARLDVLGARYLLPVGLAGPRWLVRSFDLRYR